MSVTQNTKCEIFTSNGAIILNESVTIPSSNIFNRSVQFYLHDFSENYDLLTGRNLLSDGQSIINYKNSTVSINLIQTQIKIILFTFKNKKYQYQMRN